MKILLSVPFYGDISYPTCISVVDAKEWSMLNGHTLDIIWFSTSATPHCFNKHLCGAIHSDYDYWVMLHSDIGTPDKGWIQKLIDDMNAEDLAVISAVAAIKTETGVTSTGVDTAQDFPRRLTLKEIHDSPEVLTNEKCKRLFGERLLINTGMMVWNMTTMRSLASQLPFEFLTYFEPTLTQIGYLIEPKFIPEDWLMSRRLDEMGVKYGATRNVKTLHLGNKVFTNELWGEDTDPQWEKQKINGIERNDTDSKVQG